MPDQGIKIAGARTYHVKIPTRRVHSWSGSGGYVLGDFLVVTLEASDGQIGFGEAPVFPSWGGDYGRYFGETVEDAANIVRDYLAQAVNGQNPLDREKIHERMDRAIKGYPYAKGAVDIALYDLMGKCLGVPVNQLLGGCYREKIPLAQSLGSNLTPEQAAAEAKEAVGEGIRFIKMKVGQDSQRDLEAVKQVRESVGSSLPIFVDANQGWTSPKAAIAAIRKLEEFGLFFVEQPVEGLENMAKVASRVDTPVMADESAWTPHDVMEIIQRDAADYISIYVHKPSGLFGATKVAAVAESAGLRCNVNGSLELGIANAANLHLASSARIISLPGVFPLTSVKGKEPAKVAGRFYLDDIVKESFRFEDGAVLVPKGPGLGVDLDWGKMKEYGNELT